MGEVVNVCLFRDPRPLTAGKSAWNIFQAACNFFPMVRKLGHEGIVVSHYVWDRLMASALSRHVRQRHTLFYQMGAGGQLSGQQALLELKDWVLTSGCSCHDVHNALKWGLGVSEPQLIGVHKKLWIAIESLRNGYSWFQA